MQLYSNNIHIQKTNIIFSLRGTALNSIKTLVCLSIHVQTAGHPLGRRTKYYQMTREARWPTFNEMLNSP